MEFNRGRSRSWPPDALRGRGIGTARLLPPFPEVERERSGSLMADRNGLLVELWLLELGRLRLPGCGVCVRGGRETGCWDGAACRTEGSA
jgi:hypothetical protein